MMKNIFAFLFLLNAAFAFAQTNPDAQTVLHKKPRGPFSTEEKEVIVPYAIGLQNKGFLLDERAAKYDSALYWIDTALVVWGQVRDTMQCANLLKYRGYLLGQLKRHDEGLAETEKSIALYAQKNMDFGIAVARFDRAKIFAAMGNDDSAIVNVKKSLAYWQGMRIKERVLGNATLLLYIYSKAGNNAEAAKALETCNTYMKDPKGIHWQQQLDYYYVSAQHYQRTGNTKAQKKALSKYKSTKKSAAKFSPGARSLYEN